MASTSNPEITHDNRGVRPSAAGDRHRWLGWFALAVIVGMQAGTVFRPLGSLGETRLADWIDLLTPFAVIGTAALVIGPDRPPRVWSIFLVGAVAFALGHGLHLAANSVSNVTDRRVAEADIVHLWDEVVSHYVWYAGLYLVIVAIGFALRESPVPLSSADYMLATVVTITLVNTYIEGAVPWMGLAFFASGIAAARSWWPHPVAHLAGWVGGVGLILLTTWGVVWYAIDGVLFPEFSDLGWI